MRLTLLLYQLSAFLLYALFLIFLAAQAFPWTEDRYSFYLDRRKIGLWPSLATFCATWMSAASITGFTFWLSFGGYAAFTGSVYGWLLGLIFLPFAVRKLRSLRVLSLPEWLSQTYGDERLRKVAAITLVMAYTLYIVIQFRAFGTIVAHLLSIRITLASVVVYLFVLYTTFGGLPSVVRSDSLNLAIILGGVTLGAFWVLGSAGSPLHIHRELLRSSPELLSPFSGEPPLYLFAMLFTWAFGVASNPQYAIRIISAKSSRTAWKMLALAPFVVGWIYLCLTLFGLGSTLLFSAPPGVDTETGYVMLCTSVLPPLPAMLMLVAALAAAISTANSQLLLAACALCYDLGLGERNIPRDEPFREDRFLFRNRLMVALIATVALALSLLPLPGILALGRYSWAVVTLCFLLPLYFPCGRGELFLPLLGALGLHTFLVFFTALSPEYALFPSLALEWITWKILARREALHAA